MPKSPNRINTVVKNLLTSLEARGIKVSKLILYGSHAYGNPGPDSDIDIAVISKSFDKKGLLRRQELLGEAIFQLRERVELIGYGYEELQKASSLGFLSEILSRGKVVYEEERPRRT
jgi:predicted nucleotidyltransferase